MVASGIGINAGKDNPTPTNITSFFLPFGLTGLAIHNADYAAAYTNGTGANQFFSDANVQLTLGSAQNTLFSAGTVATPRVFNGTITYELVTAAVPEPSSLALLGIGSLLAWIVTRDRREKRI